jgi:hypothetical protein
MVRKTRKPNRLCPFLDRDCLKQGCEIYNETLDRCEIGLTAYNLYQLAIAIKGMSENQGLK